MTIIELINEKLGWSGRMISGSKSGYRMSNPSNLAVFNANICTKDGKIWWGDIDLTKSKNDLLQIAEATGEEIYVLFEMDGRFENEASPKLDRAVAIFYPNQTVKLRTDLHESYQL